MRCLRRQQDPAEGSLLNPGRWDGTRWVKDEPRTCAQSSLAVLKGAGAFLYHATDFVRTSFMIQSLLGRWLYQLFLELDDHDWGPSLQTQQQWLGWPIIFGAAAVAALCKIYNYRNRDDDARSQDYVYALFSSSILYFILDTLSQSGNVGAQSLTAFIIASTLVPVASAFFAKLVVPDTSNKLIFKPSQFRDDELFPVYPQATRAEKLSNLTAANAYAAASSILVWVINREVNGRTVGSTPWQLAIIAFTYIAGTFAGYKLAEHPLAFHAVAATGKGLITGAFSYAAFSGIAFLALMTHNQCENGPCWDEEINMHLTWPFLAASIGLGVFSSLTTHFSYEANHQGFQDMTENLKAIKDKLLDCFPCCGPKDRNAEGTDVLHYDIKLQRTFGERWLPCLFKSPLQRRDMYGLDNYETDSESGYDADWRPET